MKTNFRLGSRDTDYRAAHPEHSAKIAVNAMPDG